MRVAHAETRSNPMSYLSRGGPAAHGARVAAHGSGASPDLQESRRARQISFARVPDRCPGRRPPAPRRSPLWAGRNSNPAQLRGGTPPAFQVGRSPFFEPHFHVGAIAQLAQPFLVGLVTFSVQESLARLEALALGRHVGRTPLQHLNEMPPERSLDGLAYIHRLQLRKSPLEFRHRIAGIDPSQISAPGSRAVVRIQAGELGEVHSVYDAFPQVEELPFGFVLGNELVGAYQNMTHMRLLHEQRRTGAAQLEELEQMESGGASKPTADVSGLQGRQGLDIQLREPLLTAPTDHASLKRIRRIGVGGGDLSELSAVLEPLDRLFGAGTPRFQLLRGGLLGYPDQNVRDVVLGCNVFSFALLEDQILDLTLADGDLGGDLAVPQAIHQDLIAQLFPKSVEIDRIALERLPEFRQ